MLKPIPAYIVLLVHGIQFQPPVLKTKDVLGRFLPEPLHSFFLVLIATKCVSNFQFDSVKIEKRHKLFSNILGTYTKDNRREWHVTLPFLTNVINTAFSPVIRYNPFYKVFGQDFRIPYDEFIESKQYYNDSVDYKQEFINRMRKTYKLVKKNRKIKNKTRSQKHPKYQGRI